MKLFKNFLFMTLIAGFAGNIYAGSASIKLSALTDTLIKGYTSKAGASKTALAVFPLNCDEKLEKQRVGFAASEVMSHRFVAHGAFTVVERGEIGKLLSEQKLQASGAVDSDTAVRLGKVLGAGVILLGNIQKVDGKYQVNARLVNAETAEVLVSGYTELDTNAFETDARVYLNLVPQEQTLGVYAVYNYRERSNKNPAFAESPGPSQIITTIPNKFSSPLVGGGLLYRPGRHMQINAECLTLIGGPRYATVVSSSTPYGSTIIVATRPDFKMTSISVMVSYVSDLWRNLGYLAGIGIQDINAAIDRKKGNILSGGFVKLGAEFKPQSRIGLGVNLKYEMYRVIKRSEQSKNKMMELTPLSIESVLTLYF